MGYVSEGEAYDADSFYPTGKIYVGNTGHVSNQYRIGEKLSFTKDATANLYCRAGFSKNEVVQTWTEEETAEMYFELEGKYDNLLLELEYDTFTPPKRVKIYANEKKLRIILRTDMSKSNLLFRRNMWRMVY